MDGDRCRLDFGGSHEWRARSQLITGVGVARFHMGVRPNDTEVIEAIQRCWPGHDVKVSVDARGSASSVVFLHPEDVDNLQLVELDDAPEPPMVLKSAARILIDNVEMPVYLKSSDVVVPG